MIAQTVSIHCWARNSFASRQYPLIFILYDLRKGITAFNRKLPKDDGDQLHSSTCVYRSFSIRLNKSYLINQLPVPFLFL